MRNKTNIITAVGIVVLLLLASTTWAQSTATGRGRGTPTHSVTVQSNVPGAQLSIDGRGTIGGTPQTLSLPTGSYTLRVNASGYQEWSLTLQIDRDQNLAANLQPITHTLAVNSNVSGARVLINNQDRGATNFSTALSPGNYNVIVRAPGYVDFTQSVNLTSNQTINAQLRPATATVSLNIPANILDRTVNNAAGQVQVFVDNAQVGGASFEVPAGRRTIRVRSGGLSAEISMDFVAGTQYTLTPFFSVNVQ